MKYVIDASVAFKWLVAEANTEEALRFRDDYLAASIELLAPDVFPVEIAHSLTRAERQGRLLVSESSQLLASLLRILPAMTDSLTLLPRGCEMSSRYRVGIYDCLYVALAEREVCEFVTADSRLVNSLGQDFPFLVELSTAP